MVALTKADLLATKPKIETVAIPEMGDEMIVHLREMTAADVVAYATLHAVLDGDDRQKTRKLMDFMLSRSLCDADGQRLFSDDESPLDVLTFVVANRLWLKALELNRIGDTDTPKKSSETEPSSTLHAA